MAQETTPLLQTEVVEKNQSTSYQVGDRIQLNIRIPIELSQELGSVQLKSLDEKTSLDQIGWYLDPSPQIINGNLRFIASPIKTGKLVLPELAIIKTEGKMIAKTSSIAIEVAELAANPSSTPALLETIPISLPLKFAILGAFILIGLIFACYFAYKKYKQTRKPEPVAPEIKIPPTPDHVIALRELNLLYEQYSYSKENLKPIAFGVSQILKNFFSARFKVDAKESTTDEMISLLRGESLSSQDLKKILGLFQNLDLIKFTELNYHQHFQNGDYLEFKDQARNLIETWAIKGDFK